MHHAVIAFLLLLTLLGAFPLDVILPSFPAISADMTVDTRQVALSVSLFALAVAIAQLIVGPLSDQIGRRRLLLTGLTLSIAGALGCTLTSHYPTFLASRVMQALGCGCFVLSQALIQDLFTARQRNRLRILLTTASGLFISISPLLGSWLQNSFDWQASFVAFSVLAGVVWLMCLSMLPKDHRPMGIRTGPIEAYGPLLRDRSFLRLGALASVAFSCHFAFIVISPLMFMERLGLSAERFGEFFLLFGLAYLAAGLLAQRLDKYLKPLQQMGLGLVLISLAGAMLIFKWQELTPLRLLVPAIVGATGTTLVRPAATSCALALHPDRAGAAAALLSTLVFAAGALASAVIALLSDHLPGSLGAGFLIVAAAGAALLWTEGPIRNID